MLLLWTLLCISIRDAAPVNVTVGVLLTYTGSWQSYAEGTMTNLQLWEEHLQSLPELQVSFVHVDVEKSKEIAEQAAFGLIHGNYTGQIMSGNLAPVDVLIAPYSTSRTERVAMVTERHNIPLLGTTSTDYQLYKTGDAPRPYSTYTWSHTLARNQYTNMIHSLHLQGATRLSLVYDANEGFNDNEIEGIREAATQMGMTIDLDEGWTNHGDQNELSLLKDGDILVAAFYSGNGACESIVNYLHDHDINFNAMIFAVCSGSAFRSELNEKSDYILNSVLWHPLIGGSDFEDNRFSAWQRFPNASEYASAFMQARGRVPDYRDASSMAALYRLNAAIARGGANWRQYLENHVEPSFYGWIGSDGLTSYNPHARVVSIQNCRNKDCYNPAVSTSQIVLPTESSQQMMVYPIPNWSDRICYPDCVECELCEMLFKLTTNVLYSLVITCFVTMGGTYYYFKKYHQEEKTLKDVQWEAIVYWPTVALLLYSTFMEIISLVNYIAFRDSLGFSMWKIVVVGISVGISFLMRVLDTRDTIFKIYYVHQEIHYTCETTKQEWEQVTRKHRRDTLGLKNVILSAAGQTPIFLFNIILLATSDVQIKSALSIIISIIVTAFSLGKMAVTYTDTHDIEELGVLIQYCASNSRTSIRPKDISFYIKNKKFEKKHGDEKREVQNKFQNIVRLASPKKARSQPNFSDKVIVSPNTNELNIVRLASPAKAPSQPNISEPIPVPANTNELPQGWRECIQPDSGRAYYVNDIEKTTTWDDPRNAPPQFNVASEV